MSESNKNIPANGIEYAEWCQLNGITEDVSTFKKLLGDCVGAHLLVEHLKEQYKTVQPTSQGIYEPLTQLDLASKNLLDFLGKVAAKRLFEENND